MRDQQQKHSGLSGGRRVLLTLDMMALALADRGHKWSDDERRAYERSVELLTSFGGCTGTGSSV